MSENSEESSNLEPSLDDENSIFLKPTTKREFSKNWLSTAVIGTVGYVSFRYAHVPFSEASEAVGGISPDIEEATSIVDLAKAQVGLLAQNLLLTAQTCVEIGGAVGAIYSMGNVAVRGFMAVMIENHQETKG